MSCRQLAQLGYQALSQMPYLLPSQSHRRQVHTQVDQQCHRATWLPHLALLDRLPVDISCHQVAQLHRQGRTRMLYLLPLQLLTRVPALLYLLEALQSDLHQATTLPHLEALSKLLRHTQAGILRLLPPQGPRVPPLARIQRHCLLLLVTQAPRPQQVLAPRSSIALLGLRAIRHRLSFRTSRQGLQTCLAMTPTPTRIRKLSRPASLQVSLVVPPDLGTSY